MAMNREQILRSIRINPEVPVLIIGAGINGIGTFRDLALQGVDVLMIDRGDFCSGASSASSHMLHGGIRYLENGEFRLVREALHERNRLLRNAPHYAKPLPTVIPIFKWFSGLFNAPLKFLGLLERPAERGAVVIKLGLMLYDAYVRGDSPMPAHRFAMRREALRMFPALNPEIICVATYYDGQMPTPERLCIDLIRDAEADHPQARAINYVSVVGASGDSVTLRDELTSERLTVRPRVVVNAAGPWIDLTNLAMGRQTHFIGGTKGSHLILNHPELRAAIADHEFFFENYDGRIVLIFPLLDKVLVGTTDIRIDNPDEARCTEEEVDYMLGMIGRVFPSIHVDRSHIVMRFSGVRPLPTSRVGFTGHISRDHHIEVVEPNGVLSFPILSLVGGKWTTFRAFAEQVTDEVLGRLGILRRASTRDLPIGGGRDYPRTVEDQRCWLEALAAQSGLPLERVRVLFERYGTRAAEFAAYIAEGEDRPLQHHAGYSHREIAYIAQQEKVVHLDDIVLRRSLMAWLGELTPALVEELAEVVGEALGWSEEERLAEAARTFGVLAEYYAVRFEEG